MFGRRGLGAVIAACLMGGMSAGAMTQPAPMVTINAPRRAKKGLFGGSYSHNVMIYGHRGAGITMAQQQRASRKAKNVKRHRAAGRG